MIVSHTFYTHTDNTSQNITVSLNSGNDYSSGLVVTTRDYRRLSGSLLSLASVSQAPAQYKAPWSCCLYFWKVNRVLLSPVVRLQVKSINSSSSSTCANESSCWGGAGEADNCSVVNAPVTTPENLYLMGKDTHHLSGMRRTGLIKS